METGNKKWLSKILQNLNDFDFKEINIGKFEGVDKKEENKILNDWIAGEVEVVDAKLGDSPIDEVRLLLWKQLPPKKPKSNLTPSDNNYEGVVARVRRLNSKTGYRNDNFYLEKKNEQGELIEFERLKKIVLFSC